MKISDRFKEGDTIFIPSYNIVKAQIIRIFDDSYSHTKNFDGPSYFKGLEGLTEKEAIARLIEYLQSGNSRHENI